MENNDKIFFTQGSDNDLKNKTSTTTPLTPLTTTSNIYFANYTRYIVLILSTAALTLVFSNSLALNFTIICMTKETTVNSSCILQSNSSNRNNATTEAEELYSLKERSYLFSAVPLGTLLGSLPITYFTSNFGFRKVFVTYGLLSAVATLASPLAVSFGFVSLFILRIIQGIAVSLCYVAMGMSTFCFLSFNVLHILGAISAEWSPTKSSGLYLSWISCHLQFGPMFTMPLAGALCPTWGWRSLYYIQGSLSLVIFTLFFYFFRDSPRFQRNVSEKELNKIELGKVRIKTGKKEKQSVPYSAMLSDSVVWGIMATSTAGMLGFHVIQIFGPIYLNKALKLDIKDTGIAAALPFALSCFIKMLAGPLSDYVSCISNKTRVILFSSISQFMMAVCYAALKFLPKEEITTIRIFFTLVVVFSGLAAVGSVKGSHLATQHFCHVLMAWTTILTSILNLILPFLVSIFVPDNTIEQWGHIFLCIAVLLMVANVFFTITIKVEPRPWTADDYKKFSNKKFLPQKIQSIQSIDSIAKSNSNLSHNTQ